MIWYKYTIKMKDEKTAPNNPLDTLICYAGNIFLNVKTL